MTAVLDELEGLLREATPRMWHRIAGGRMVVSGSDIVATDMSPADAALTCAMRNRFDALLAVARAAVAWSEARGDDNATTMALLEAVAPLRAEKDGGGL